MKQILSLLFILFSIVGWGQCDVVVVDGTQSYTDYNPGVSFTFDIVNNGITPYSSGDFHLGFGFVGGAGDPVWTFDLNPALQPGETITITTPVLDIPLYDNPAEWPFWGTSVPNSWPAGYYDFSLFLDGCLFDQVQIPDVVITDDTCLNPDGDQFCSTCDLEILDFTWPDLTVYANDATGCYNPEGPNPNWLPIPTDSIYLFQIYFLLEPGAVTNISNADIPNMGTGDTVVVDIVNLIQDPDYLEELLWYLDNGCEVITYVTNPNNISNIEIETDLNYLSIGGTLLCEYSPGCTDPEALNYNPDAIEDDGSCEYGSLELDLLGEEIWEIGGTCTDPYFNQSFVVENTGEAVIDSFLLDIFITTWDNQFVTSLSQTFYPSLEVGEQYTINNLPNFYTGDLNYVFVSISWYDENGELVVDTQSFNVIIYCWGCTDPEANNYIDSPYVFDEIQDYWTNDFPNITPPTPEEIECTYDIYGCTDDEANNYNPDANIDDGSCTYDIFGCTDPGANNFNPLANVDDGSCTYDVFGCTDPSALNYNSLANVDDGSCEYDVPGCTDPAATNYNPLATVDDGSCEYIIYLGGCTDPEALNYNPLATYDDGTCITECEAWAPNTFSPNNDGTNDAWYVVTDSSCWLDWYVAVFDRWGRLVWESTNPNDKWEGSNNGGSYYVADGVYVFLIRAQGYNTGDTFQTTGHITLFR